MDFPHQALQFLLSILVSQHRMGQKELERLVGKIRFMYIAVPGAVAHIYHIQRAITQGGKDRAWLLAEFHRGIDEWRALVAQAFPRPTHLAEIVR